MRSDLAPIAAQGGSYGLFDAAIILLREGLEALLVVAALVPSSSGLTTATRRAGSGPAAGRAWWPAWRLAIVVNIVFGAPRPGSNRELLEGITGLFAAVMLVYMSYWLHSKASLAPGSATSATRAPPHWPATACSRWR